VGADQYAAGGDKSATNGTVQELPRSPGGRGGPVPGVEERDRAPRASGHAEAYRPDANLTPIRR